MSKSIERCLVVVVLSGIFKRAPYLNNRPVVQFSQMAYRSGGRFVSSALGNAWSPPDPRLINTTLHVYRHSRLFPTYYLGTSEIVTIARAVNFSEVLLANTAINADSETRAALLVLSVLGYTICIYIHIYSKRERRKERGERGDEWETDR